MPVFQVYHYTRTFPMPNTTIMSNTDLHTMCFQDFNNKKGWGYGRKRIGIKIQGTITDKVPFSGFGFKDMDGKYYIGVRMWLDQGNYVKKLPYTNTIAINQHFIDLIKAFQYQYGHIFNM